MPLAFCESRTGADLSLPLAPSQVIQRRSVELLGLFHPTNPHPFQLLRLLAAPATLPTKSPPGLEAHMFTVFRTDY